MRPYRLDGLILNASSTSPQQRALVLTLQEDLRALGYLAGGLDGEFGPGTSRAIAALTYDLMNNTGASSQNDGTAPIAMTDYNQGRISSVQGDLDQPLAACLDELISDAAVPKLPRASDPVRENAKALATVQAMLDAPAPAPFMLAMFVQESACAHFKVPSVRDADDFITIGLDRNDSTHDFRITSRGYGLGQATLFHHPPKPSEIASLMVDVGGNVHAAFAELRGKFDRFLVGPASQADDRHVEHPSLRLRVCRYPTSDPRYLMDCRICARSVRTVTIKTGTRLFAGSSDTYQPDKYYPTANYGSVPDRAAFLCDWPYAARRYNGDGLNSYHYQTHVLLNLTRLPPPAQDLVS